MAKRRVRAAAAKTAQVETESEPEHDGPRSNQDVPVSRCPGPIIPLHLQPATDTSTKRARLSGPDEEDSNGESSPAQGRRRKKRAGSGMACQDSHRPYSSLLTLKL